jgi:hypothetical protein
MELRWYWRVLRRQWRIIWVTTALVALLAAIFSAYTFIGSSYKAVGTVEFYAQPARLGGTSANQNPQAIADASAFDARDTAKQYSETIPYFKSLAASMKSVYGRSMDWRTISANFGATPAGGRQMDFEYTGSNSTLDAEVVTVAIERIEKDFLPAYAAETYAPANSLVTTYPVQMRLLAPVDGKSASKTTAVTGWLLKAAVGLILGIALAFLWEYIDESIHDEQDVRTWMHTPTLGVIPGGKGRVA